MLLISKSAGFLGLALENDMEVAKGGMAIQRYYGTRLWMVSSQLMTICCHLMELQDPLCYA